MTTPTDNTPIAIIDDSYHDAGLVQEGDSVNPEQIVSGMRKLTDLINLWQTQGLKLWLNTDQSIDLVASQGTYVFAPSGGDVTVARPPRILAAWIVDTDSNRRPLVVLSWDDYIRLSNITDTGTINSYFVNKKATQTDVFFWQIPDSTEAANTAHVLMQSQVTGPISLTETMNFPIEWRIALRWGLADEICTGQPQAIMDRCSQRAGAYRTVLEDFDVEDTPTRLSPDPQFIAPRRFR